ncbi:TIGR04222 domain-containing membrane protein [Parerythrobacter aurantius]|uniref:TIGR04222 domain-containing membrane protein n=1 Tax=Parerythrobacter aurantius TaxID=3127706 RepID=UPI00324E40EB
MEFFGAYSGSDFLVFYGGLLVAAVAAGLWIPAFLRAEGRLATLADADEAAVLAGGPGRMTIAVLTGLYADGALQSFGKDKMLVGRGHEAPTPAGRAILRTSGSFSLPQAHRALKDHASRVEQRLIDKGLLIDKPARWQMRLLAILPYLAVLALGWYRQRAGDALGEPTAFLVALMVLTAVLAIWRLSSINPRTRGGENLLSSERDRSARLRSAPTAPEAGFAVALFGTGVLVGTPFEPVHAMRQQAGSDSGSGGGDSSGDSGCGGGGCGGCGG